MNAQELAADLMCNKEWFKYAPVGLFVVSTDGRIIEVNLIATQFLGIELGDMYGCLMVSLLAPENRLTFLTLQKHLLNGSCREVGEIQISVLPAYRPLIATRRIQIFTNDNRCFTVRIVPSYCCNYCLALCANEHTIFFKTTNIVSI